MSLSEQFDDIRGRLEVIAEELADLALDRLRESLAEGTGAEGIGAADERRLTRARRAVEKAAAILGPENRPDEL